MSLALISWNSVDLCVALGWLMEKWLIISIATHCPVTWHIVGAQHTGTEELLDLKASYEGAMVFITKSTDKIHDIVL